MVQLSVFLFVLEISKIAFSLGWVLLQKMSNLILVSITFLLPIIWVIGLNAMHILKIPELVIS